jgi:hypothetical protein
VVITATGATTGATASITLLRSNVTTYSDSILTDSDFYWQNFGSTFWNSDGGFQRNPTP